jgi:tartrate-resistant acid phosphatase type 5
LSIRKRHSFYIPCLILLVCAALGACHPARPPSGTLTPRASLAQAVVANTPSGTSYAYLPYQSDHKPPSATPSPTATQTATPTATPSVTQTPTETTIPAVHFAVIGDYGLAGQYEADVAALVASWNPDFVLTVGDNNYPYGSSTTIDENIGQYYHAYIFPYTVSYGNGADVNRFFPSLGNHDWITSNAQPYLDYFELPGNKRYYDFSWGAVQFYALDSDPHEPDAVGLSSVQAGWLHAELANSVLPWKVVYFHHAAYSSGPHGSTNWMQWPFAQWGASAVLAGHDHTYERLSIDGIPYFVNGLGGGAIYSFGDILPQSQVHYNNNWGAMLVEADASHMTFQFITRAGDIVDTYTLTQP